MQALAKWLKVDPRWLRYGGVLEDSFVVDYMSLSEEDKATVRAVVGVFGRGGTSNSANHLSKIVCIPEP
jgi:hypothetical protein